MPQFFDLPRELRDMVYMATITWERPRPLHHNNNAVHGWLQSTTGRRSWDDYGCNFAPDKVPSTCASLLVVSRQVNHEMMQSVNRARRKNALLAKIYCIADDRDRHWFNWLSLPLVHTTTQTSPETAPLSGWAPKVPVVARLLLAAPQRKQSTSGTKRTTTIEQLQIDLLSFKAADHDLPRLADSSQRTSWAVCEALKRLFEYTLSRHCHLTINTLTLNVLSPLRPTNHGDEAPRQDPERTGDSLTSTAEFEVMLARNLINVWNELWSSGQVKAQRYRHLLGRIQRVRVCVDGRVVRERELKLELERGQAEARRIAARVGW